MEVSVDALKVTRSRTEQESSAFVNDRSEGAARGTLPCQFYSPGP